MKQWNQVNSNGEKFDELGEVITCSHETPKIYFENYEEETFAEALPELLKLVFHLNENVILKALECGLSSKQHYAFTDTGIGIIDEQWSAIINSYQQHIFDETSVVEFDPSMTIIRAEDDVSGVIIYKDSSLTGSDRIRKKRYLENTVQMSYEDVDLFNKVKLYMPNLRATTLPEEFRHQPPFHPDEPEPDNY